MAEVVCLDTHILIWGIQGHATEGQEHLIAKTDALLVDLQKRKAHVIVPSIVFAEFLVKIPPEQHPRFSEIIMRNFVVVPFDMAAAPYYSRLWNKRWSAGILTHLKGLELDHVPTRNELKADMMIIATAQSLRATCIYGHDKPMETLCQGEIDFRDIETEPLQSVMHGVLRS